MIALSNEKEIMLSFPRIIKFNAIMCLNSIREPNVPNIKNYNNSIGEPNVPNTWLNSILSSLD